MVEQDEGGGDDRTDPPGAEAHAAQRLRASALIGRALSWKEWLALPKLALSLGHVVTYKMGVSIVLGDAGTAVEHARTIVPDEIPTSERRASYCTGIAEAYTLSGKTDLAVHSEK